MAGPDDTSGATHAEARSAPPPEPFGDGGDDGTAPVGPAGRAMDDAELAEAFERIDAALQALDATVDAHLENHLDNAAAAAEVQRLNADRARLARALDEAEARAARLDEVNRDVSRRLVAAMETIRSVLES